MKTTGDRRLQYPTSLFTVAAVGVFLTLLVIFFVVTPLYRESGPVRPTTRSAQAHPATAHDLSIHLLADGQVVVGKKYVADTDLPDALRQIKQVSGDRRIVLDADRLLTYERIDLVVRAARDVGFSEILLVTGPRDILEAMQQEERDSPGAAPPH